MKRLVLILITVFCMCCLAACGGETKEDVVAGNDKEVLGNSAEESVVTTEATPAPTEEPEATEEPVEATVAPTEEPVEEVTPAPTEEPSVVYEGIDMESTLPGREWLETFVGVIEEPKVVIFSDITGKKVIAEQEGEVSVNPDEDAMALFIPEGYTNGNVSNGIVTSDKEIISTKNYEIFYLDSEKMREVDESKAVFLVMHGDERVVLIVNLKIE